METLPRRKIRPALAFEPLEGRCLLSQFGAGPGWEGSARPIVDSESEVGPISGGPPTSRDSGFAASIPGLAPGGPFRFDALEIGLQGGSLEAESLASSCVLIVAETPANVTSAPLSAESASKLSTPAIGSDPKPGGASLESSPSPSPLAPSFPALVATPRGPSTFSIARLASSTVQPTSRVDLTADPASTPRSSANETLMAATSAIPGLPEVAASPDQARGPVTINPPTAPTASLAVPVASGMIASPSNPPAPADLARSSEVPISQGLEGGGAEPREGFERPAEAWSLETLEIGAPEPALADLIQGFVPFDRGAMASAIDRFLEPFDSLGSTMPGFRGPMGLITASLAAAATVVAVEVAIRIRKARDRDRDRDRDHETDESEGLASFTRF